MKHITNLSHSSCKVVVVIIFPHVCLTSSSLKYRSKETMKVKHQHVLRKESLIPAPVEACLMKGMRLENNLKEEGEVIICWNSLSKVHRRWKFQRKELAKRKVKRGIHWKLFAHVNDLWYISLIASCFDHRRIFFPKGFQKDSARVEMSGRYKKMAKW